MISIFITSRVEGNANSNIERLVASFKEKSFDISNFELLVKYDDDDECRYPAIDFLKKSGLNVKILLGPRGRGYQDVHKGYQSLIRLASKDSQVFTCFADDFIIVYDNWDKHVLDLVKKINSDIFIIHQRNHPPSNRLFFDWCRYFINYNLQDIENLYIVDESPLWSSKLIRLLNCFGNVFTCDAWTLFLEKNLADVHKMNITYFVREPIIYRNVNPKIDGPSAERWKTIRNNTLSYMRSKDFFNLIMAEAEKIVSNMKQNSFNIFKYKIRFYFYFFLPSIFNITYILFGRILKYFSLQFLPRRDPTLLGCFLEHNIIAFNGKTYLIPHFLGPIDMSEENFVEKFQGAIITSSIPALLYMRLLFKALLRRVSYKANR